MAATDLDTDFQARIGLFLDASPVSTLENLILWLVEELADIQANPTLNQSNSQEVTAYTYNGLTGAVNITLAFQSESWADNTGVILKAASLIG